jgi:hypothetical protein
MLGISTSEVDSLLQGVRSEGYAQVVESVAIQKKGERLDNASDG